MYIQIEYIHTHCNLLLQKHHWGIPKISIRHLQRCCAGRVRANWYMFLRINHQKSLTLKYLDTLW